MPTTIIEEVQQAWGWIGIEAEEVVRENDFGHLIVKDKRGSYWRISPEELSCEVLARNRGEFDAFSLDQSFVADWSMRALLEQAEARLGPLVPGRKYCFKIPTVFGGEYRGENLATISLIELIRVSGDLARQIKDMPDGTPVRLKMVD
jgi:hypothetical protein